ncbi:hypothetical protein ACF068_17445 [Streptomyces sp. NPDC016309]|uniref:hypothetical protein n=1 Tax=Streptomyces sp. NPDC016309 TaxID=3364965 RepID=UPI0036F63E05
MSSPHPSPPTGAPRPRNVAMICGGTSVAIWFCCPFWMLVWLLALPLGATGLVRSLLDLRTASRFGHPRTPPLLALALSATGTAAAVAYLLFLLTHPDLPIQD